MQQDQQIVSERLMAEDLQNIQTSRQYKGCESFLNRLRRMNHSLYQKLVAVTQNFSQNHQPIKEYHSELQRMFGDQSEIVSELNKLLYADARIQTEKKVEVPEPPTRVQSYFLQQIHCHQILQSRDIKLELNFFEQFRTTCQQHFAKEEDFNVFFSEFMKVLSLYNECIISHFDFMELVGQIKWLDNSMIDHLCIMTMSRAQARRSSSLLFKPLKDTDFKTASRVTRSYVRMHPGYANTTTQNGPVKTNQIWVSVPFGSEDYSFQIMRKNTYEEQLFKIEDEKYEFDWNTLCYKRCIKLLLELASTTNPEKQDILVYKILNLKVLQQIYKSSSTDQQEIISLLEKHPSECAQILAERVQTKCNEIVDTRNNGARISWESIQNSNFHRSLDHRSFYFKKNEKIFTCSNKFLKEPEDKFKNLLYHFYPELIDEATLAIKKKNTDEKIPQFKIEDLQLYLNSFASLTTYQPPSSLSQARMCVTPSKTNFVLLPLFNMYLAKKEILQETFLYLIYHSQTFFNVSEKNWMFRFLVKIAQGFFGLKLSSMLQDNIITNEVLLTTEVQEIEQSIFDANFSYLQTSSSHHIMEETHIQIKQSIKQDSTSPNHEQKEPPIQPMESENESQLSKMLTATPSQTEQDVYTESQFQNTQSQWMQFQPSKQADPNLKVIYGSQGLYLFFRYFYTIYQRLEIAQEISFNFDTNWKTERLDVKQLYAIGQKRYNCFKSALYLSLGVKDFKYEDYLRCIFAKQSFLFSTMEKLLHDCCKQLVMFQNDRVFDTQMNSIFRELQVEDIEAIQQEFLRPSSKDFLIPPLFEMNNTISEDMQFVLLTHSIIENVSDRSEKSIYRMAFSDGGKDDIKAQLSINYIPHWGQISDKSQLQKTQFYLNKYITYQPSENKPYLERNVPKRVQKTQKRIFSVNQLEFAQSENAELRLLKDSHEDQIVVRRKEAKKKPHVIKNHVRNSLGKLHQ